MKLVIGQQVHYLVGMIGQGLYRICHIMDMDMVFFLPHFLDFMIL